MDTSTVNSPNKTYSVTISRLMLPDDANFAGNVHGGTLFKLIEEAGEIVCKRYFHDKNRQKPIPCLVLAARLEHTDFIRPVFIGDVVEICATVTFTSHHSIECYVEVHADDIKMIEGNRLTNRAVIWYVVVDKNDHSKTLMIPPMTFSDEKQEQEGWERYKKQKALRWLKQHREEDIESVDTSDHPAHSVAGSQSTVMHLVAPSDCASDGEYARAGVLLKWMDECAAIVAMKHCKSNVVTAGLDATNFHLKIPRGCLVTLTGQVIFTSNKSVEIEVLVDLQNLFKSSDATKERAVDAFFTFVSLDKNENAMPVPALQLLSDGERKRFAQGKRRYELRKENRKIRKLSINDASNLSLITPL